MVLRGTKTFTLLPPSAAFRMHIEKYRTAKYERNGEGTLELVPSGSDTLVPWSPIELPIGNLSMKSETLTVRLCLKSIIANVATSMTDIESLCWYLFLVHQGTDSNHP